MPTQAVPSFGGLHLPALFLIEHFTLPRRSTRQHVTASSFPQVDFAAHRTTSPLQFDGNAPVSANPFATLFEMLAEKESRRESRRQQMREARDKAAATMGVPAETGVPEDAAPAQP